MRLEQAAGRWDRPVSSRKIAAESPGSHRGTRGRTRWLQLTALSEAGGLCAMQDKGVASNCYGYAPILLRSARALYDWGSEQQPKRKA